MWSRCDLLPIAAHVMTHKHADVRYCCARACPNVQMTIEIQPTHAMQIAVLEITAMHIALQVRRGVLLLSVLSLPFDSAHLDGACVVLATASEHRLRFLAVRCSKDCGSAGDPRC